MSGSWLHWVGRTLYSPKKFEAESLKYGITRRVSPKVLRGMAWGDRVYLIGLKDKKRKQGQIFGYFFVHRIVGISEGVTEKLFSEGRAHITDIGGKVVNRKCGSYVEGPSYSVSAEVSEIAEIQAETGEKTPLMVGGAFVKVDPPVRMKDIPFQQGFRRFDGDDFERRRAEGETVMTGMFYTDFLPQEEDQPAPNEGEATVLLNYERKR